jgi:hypothetical protein
MKDIYVITIQIYISKIKDVFIADIVIVVDGVAKKTIS